jgi:hypothetical protein
VSATQFDGPPPTRRSGSTLAIVIAIVSMMMIGGGVFAVVALGDPGGGPGPDPTPTPAPPQPSPTPPQPSPTPPQPTPTPPQPTPTPPQPAQGVDPNRYCSGDPTLGAPTTEQIEGETFEFYDTNGNGVPDVGVVEDPKAGTIVLADPDEDGSWPVGGTCAGDQFMEVT